MNFTTEASLREATRNSLTRAVETHLTSIAFPALGTGIAGFPLDHCAQIMLAEVRKHLASPTTLQRILFVLFEDTALKVFQATLTTMPE